MDEKKQQVAMECHPYIKSLPKILLSSMGREPNPGLTGTYC